SLNRVNFIEKLRWASSTDPVALSILEDSDRNATYLSPNIQNELISLNKITDTLFCLFSGMKIGRLN
ncbi:unnamed protein product, partial [Rotaria sp. Silwood2]